MFSHAASQRAVLLDPLSLLFAYPLQASSNRNREFRRNTAHSLRGTVIFTRLNYRPARNGLPAGDMFHSVGLFYSWTCSRNDYDNRFAVCKTANSPANTPLLRFF